MEKLIAVCKGFNDIKIPKIYEAEERNSNYPCPTLELEIDGKNVEVILQFPAYHKIYEYVERQIDLEDLNEVLRSEVDDPEAIEIAKRYTDLVLAEYNYLKFSDGLWNNKMMAAIDHTVKAVKEKQVDLWRWDRLYNDIPQK